MIREDKQSSLRITHELDIRVLERNHKSQLCRGYQSDLYATHILHGKILFNSIRGTIDSSMKTAEVAQVHGVSILGNDTEVDSLLMGRIL